MSKNCLSPSILAANFATLGDDVNKATEAGSPYIHFDVMDGHFVPSISFGIPVLESLRKATDAVLDVHLMIENPDSYIADFADAGADIITVHAEACRHLDYTVNSIKKAGKMAGVALNPATPIETIKHVLPMVDMVLIMTVNPGWGGQKLIPYCLDKVRELKAYRDGEGLRFDIEIDGGATLNNIGSILDAGANIVVAGSAVFKGDIAKNVEAFLEVMN